MAELKRRDFLKVLGASSATVASACSSAEPEKLISYVIPPEEVVPGIPTRYASTCRECPAGCGIHVETHSGRVTKVEGNPLQPISRGNLCLRGQAAPQGLYHPDRIGNPQVIEEAGLGPTHLAWSTAERLIADAMRESARRGPGRVVLLHGGYSGDSTMGRLVGEWTRATGARAVQWAPLENTPRDLDFADAQVLVSFGADFLETYGSPVDYSWQFTRMHAYRDGRRGFFAWVGPHRPLTGLNADLWIAPRPGTEGRIAQLLLGEVDVATAARDCGLEEKNEQAKLQRLAAEWRARSAGGRGRAIGPGMALTGRNAQQLRASIARLNGGAQGSPAARTPSPLGPIAQLVAQMNAGQLDVLLIEAHNPAYTLPGGLGFAEALLKVPTRVSFSTFPDDTSRLCNFLLPQPHFLEMWDDYVPYPGVRMLVQPAMRPIHGTRQVGDVLLGVARQLRTPAAPPLAAAPAAAAAAGATSAAQGGATAPGAAGPQGAPVAAPAAPTAAGGLGANSYFEYLRRAWGATGSSAGEVAWRTALERGGSFPISPAGVASIAGNERAPTETPTAAETPARIEAAAGAPAVAAAGAGAAAPLVAAPLAPPTPGAAVAAAAGPLFQGPSDAQYTLVVYPSHRFFDGRTANRPWLLELPDPVTKVSWNSWVEVHPETARRLELDQNDLVEVKSLHGTLQVPVYLYPGVRQDTVAIQMGLGHDAFGRFSEGRGVNPMRLLGSATDAATGEMAPYSVRVSLRKTGEKARIFEEGVRVQHEREVARAVSFTELVRSDQAGRGKIPGTDTEIETLKLSGGFAPARTDTDPAEYPTPGTHYNQYVEGAARWAMVLDLDRCIGCGACEVACYAENNIPVVGPDQVAKGRRMSWLRVERYWGEGTMDEDESRRVPVEGTRFLPMLCQHCGNAPCEPVCPVYAAYHTPDGLNAQVYNRCVGTRYCANNCPYRVRYFNWYTYDFPDPMHMQLNPYVTVRQKGVMEKCTFCVQRINSAERAAVSENRAIRDGEVIPACVQTCPTEVFTFGNIQDPNSDVTHAARSNRSYRVLEEINTQPAVVYLKQVTFEEPGHGTVAGPTHGSLFGSTTGGADSAIGGRAGGGGH